MADFFPPLKELSSCIRISREERKNLTEKLKLTNPKDKGTLKDVEEMAIQRTMEYMWNKKYWVLREQQSKGIHPNAKQIPRFRPRPDKKFINRDRVIKRIVSIVHNGKIKFLEGYHEEYKNLKEKYIKII